MSCLHSFRKAYILGMSTFMHIYILSEAHVHSWVQRALYRTFLLIYILSKRPTFLHMHILAHLHSMRSTSTFVGAKSPILFWKNCESTARVARPIHPPKSPIHLEKSLVFPQKSPVSFWQNCESTAREVYTPRKWKEYCGRQCDAFALVEGLLSCTESQDVFSWRSTLRASGNSIAAGNVMCLLS